jgi:hypothetical protein
MLSARQAYQLGETLHQSNGALTERLLTAKTLSALKRHQIRGVTIHENENGEPDKVNYQLTPTIILNFPRIDLSGNFTFGRARDDRLELRTSVTICPYNTRSKFWIRISPSRPIALRYCDGFYLRATQIADTVSDLLINYYNTSMVQRVLKRKFHHFFKILVGIHSTSDVAIGRQIREQVAIDRAPGGHKSTTNLPPALEQYISVAEEYLASPNNPIAGGKSQEQKYFTYLTMREPEVYRLSGYTSQDTDSAPIYGACRVQVYEKLASIMGVAYEPKTTHGVRSPTASVIVSSDLAAEFGSSY